MSEEAKNLVPLVCPKCGREPERIGTRFGRLDKCCGLWSWGGKPLTDSKTHDARQAAHAAFDPIWKEGHLKRSYAYQRLAEELGLRPQDAHMSIMPENIALRVPAAAERIRKSITESTPTATRSTGKINEP